MERIGWIGVGVMGSRMLPHLLDAGHMVTVCDHDRAAVSRLPAKVTWVPTPARVAEVSDVVITIVSMPADVERVYFADDGVFAGARAGMILVDMTTSSPDLARRIAAAAEAAGVDALDAPVSGGPTGAEAASLSVMVGGRAEALERVRDILARLGSTVVHEGPAGSGQSAKLANQIAIAGAMVGVCEAFLFCKASGLLGDRVLEAIDAGIAGSDLVRYVWPRLEARDLAPGFRVEHFVKDLGLALDAAHGAAVALPGAALINELYHAVIAAGYGARGTQALIVALDRGWTEPEAEVKSTKQIPSGKSDGGSNASRET